MFRTRTKQSETGTDSPDIAVRERLLAAATKLFARKGYAPSTVREIVEAANVTKPVLYYYFRSKEGIYLDLMQRVFRKLESILGSVQSEKGGAVEKTLRLCDRVFAHFLEDIEICRIMHSIYYGPPQGAPFVDFDAVHLRFHSAIRELVKGGVSSGEFRGEDPEDMTFAILGAVHVAMEVELSHPEMHVGREGLARILRLIFDGITVRPAKPKGDAS